MLEQIAGLYKAGNLSAARQACQAQLHTADGTVRAQLLNLLSVIELQSGAYREASTVLEELVALRPNDSQAHYHLGLAYQSLGHWSQAVEPYHRAWTLEPATPHYRVNLLETLLRSHKFAQATEVIDSCSNSGPLSLAEIDFMFRALIGISDTDGVIRTLRAAIQDRSVDEGNQLCHRAARHLIAAQRHQDALVCLNLCPEIHNHFDALVCRSVVMDRLEDSAQAIRDARQACVLKPEDYHAQYNRAAILSKRFDTAALSEGREAVEKALKLSAESAEAWLTASIISGKQMDFDAAIRCAEKAITLQPGFEQAILQLADMLDRMGRSDACVQTLTVAAQHHGERSAINRQLGIALLKQGNSDAAVRALQMACRQDPSDQRSIAHLIVALADKGNSDEAERLQAFDENVAIIRMPAPEGYASVEDFNRQLADDIRSHSTLRFEPIGLAARNGYLTEELRIDASAAIGSFETLLMSAIGDYIRDRSAVADDPFLRNWPSGDVKINLWATLVNGGGQIDTHIHEDSWLSGAYYVRTGYQPDSKPMEMEDRNHAGYLELGRPHAGLPVPDSRHIRLIRPVEGTLILFPSFMFHRTVPDPMDRERISIAFDLRADESTH